MEGTEMDLSEEVDSGDIFLEKYVKQRRKKIVRYSPSLDPNWNKMWRISRCIAEKARLKKLKDQENKDL